ncbi:chemotaxis protein CheC [Halobacteria archaeon AArc-dxtr1]|nr:chemotaxis protein CheC [Halobacteria archaeon AArc-dxtr1]
MEIDIQALETYNELAHEGAQSAVDSFATLTGIPTNVEVTDVSLMAPEDLQYELSGGKYAGVSIELDGGIEGETVLAFDESARTAITETLVPADDPEMKRSSIKEVGNIMTSGFVDGWANHLNMRIKSSPPGYVEGTGAEVLPKSATQADHHLFVFRSRIETEQDGVRQPVDFQLLLVPDSESLQQALEPRNESSISFEKLEMFNTMTKEGAKKSATNITSMTGIETTVNISRLSLVPLADIPREVGETQYVGTVMSYRGRLSGYLVILFDQPSGQAVVDALIPSETDGEWGDMERAALQELGNIMTSGFIDGWANVLNTDIKHSPPQFVADVGSSIMEPVISELAENDDHAFLIDSDIETDTEGVFTCKLLSLPRRDELESVLDDILVSDAQEMSADPSDVL